MKLMNTVRAGVSGEVVRIDARNGELVEFGETILFVKS
jgi:biotin carboxyl carrier protein